MAPRKRARTIVAAPKTLPPSFDEIVLQKAGMHPDNKETLLIETYSFEGNAAVSDKDIFETQQSMCKLAPLLKHLEAKRLYVEAARVLFVGTAPRRDVETFYLTAVYDTCMKNANVIGRMYKEMLSNSFRGDVVATQLLPVLHDAMIASKAVMRALNTITHFVITEEQWSQIVLRCKMAHEAVEKCNVMQANIFVLEPAYDDISRVPGKWIVHAEDSDVGHAEVENINAHIAMFVQKQY